MAMEELFNEKRLRPSDRVLAVAELLIDQSENASILSYKATDTTLWFRVDFPDQSGNDETRDHFVTELISDLSDQFDGVDWIGRIRDEIDEETDNIIVWIDTNSLPT